MIDVAGNQCLTTPRGFRVGGRGKGRKGREVRKECEGGRVEGRVEGTMFVHSKASCSDLAWQGPSLRSPRFTSEIHFLLPDMFTVIIVRRHAICTVQLYCCLYSADFGISTSLSCRRDAERLPGMRNSAPLQCSLSSPTRGTSGITSCAVPGTETSRPCAAQDE